MEQKQRHFVAFRYFSDTKVFFLKKANSVRKHFSEHTCWVNFDLGNLEGSASFMKLCLVGFQVLLLEKGLGAGGARERFDIGVFLLMIDEVGLGGEVLVAGLAIEGFESTRNFTRDQIESRFSAK